MRRASSTPHTKTSLSLLSRDFLTQVSSLSTTTNDQNHHPSQTHLKSNDHILSKPKPHQFQTNPSHNLNTLVDPQTPHVQISSRQKDQGAKDIMDVSLGPGHVDSIEACQNLSKAYGAMGSYPLAIKFQEQVIDAWEGHGLSAQDELKEAQRLLEQLKKKA
ncbi:Protein KINESIN LIGHT CHAIN-RELATED like [Actinidia chinensis var. chinensis]|uniref:Protein KINESIN LIGHT CHAIN-RELATED like n=1 Tax=Actinidia chinensis var. chinensis TaxID=1590841 RepID=A0A2R6PPG4_ACTCC|nr:Protein KINESIN LIGHT CHAIN-RELATED like [Actinidia chinensis var. chinensis]